MGSEELLPAKRRHVTLEVPSMRQVLVIYTGGTIGMKPSVRGYVPEPGFLTSVVRSSRNLVDTSPEAAAMVPERVQNVCRAAGQEVLVSPVSEFGKRCIYSILEYEPLLDSSNMQIAEWRKIARDIKSHYDDWDSFVILHGTDTMAYTASILAFMLQNLSKTVVITGSQIPLCRPRNDGLDNLLVALHVASHFDIPEVTLCFANNLYRGCRVSKLNASQLRAFGSPNLEPLASVGVDFSVRWHLVRPPCRARFELQDFWCEDVTIIRIYPGTFTTLRSFLAPLKGVVMQTFGAGNAPDNDPEFLSVLKEATDRGCVIVNITQCVEGEVQAHYAAGTALLEAGLTPGGDMTPESALTKLGWLLGSGRTPQEVRKLMMLDLRGEITVRSSELRFSLREGGFARTRGWFAAGADGEDSQASSAVSLIQSALLPTLMCAAAARGDLQQIQAMLADGVSVNQSDYDKRTPLHLACAEGMVKTTLFLLEERADINACDRSGFLPLRSAIASGNLDIVKLLRANGGVLGQDEGELASILCRLAQNGNAEKLEIWIAAGANMNAADYDCRTALHLCAEVGSSKVGRLLLGSRADPTLKDRFGGSPLSIAKAHGHAELELMLLGPRASP